MSDDFAVVTIGGSQHKVKVGDTLQVQKLNVKAGTKTEFEDVLLTSKKGKVTIGTPSVKNAKVEAKVLEHGKGKKIRILKYKAKARYRRRIGHRQPYTKIEITKI